MRFTRDKARRFAWKGLTGWAYNEKEDFPSISGAYIEVSGSHGKVKNTICDALYYVIQGKGEFTIGSNTIRVEESDVITISKDTAYDFRARSGTMKLFLAHSPSFDPKGNVML